MAFVAADLLNKTGMPQSKADYIYLSDTDDRATVSAAGYFNNTDDSQNLAADDMIHVRGNQGDYTLRVDSVSSGSVTTAELAASANSEVVTATNVITAAETGKHFILNSASAFVSTLPAPALGLEFWFHAGTTQVTGGNHTIVTNASGNVIEGSLSSPEVVAVVAVAAAADTISFIADKAVLGDLAHVWCDGTTWYLDGHCFVQDGMTTTQAS